jgi:hypothetical protein
MKYSNAVLSTVSVSCIACIFAELAYHLKTSLLRNSVYKARHACCGSLLTVTDSKALAQTVLCAAYAARRGSRTR